ncbi:bile acid:sodium symporter family protein [Pseudactinotalea sp. Z1748]|uniref:bile acid:sodium symporter family protein n=1 Tax=Pseudactinotalea sp. Z1748 TaxID=3413027 RepID=UPI003C7AA198
MKALRRWIDPFVLLLLAALLAGLLIPVPEAARAPVNTIARAGITVLFFTYGLRLPTREVLAGLRNIRLQGSILGVTFVLWPLLGIALSWALAPLIGPALATGVLFLSVLPSTVQGSVALTSIARGNIPAAICAATISNVVGMVATPLLVLALMGSVATTGMSGMRSVLLQLLLPFVVGQVLSRWVGPWIRGRRLLTLLVDRIAITVMLFNAVSAATAQGVWSQVHWSMLITLGAFSLALLAGVSGLLWFAGPRLGLALPERIVFLLGGAQKSLATGLPMGAVLFPAATLATLVVPLIMYHQLQLILGAVLARQLARRADDDAS